MITSVIVQLVCNKRERTQHAHTAQGYVLRRRAADISRASRVSALLSCPVFCNRLGIQTRTHSTVPCRRRSGCTFRACNSAAHTLIFIAMIRTQTLIYCAVAEVEAPCVLRRAEWKRVRQLLLSCSVLSATRVSCSVFKIFAHTHAYLLHTHTHAYLLRRCGSGSALKRSRA